MEPPLQELLIDPGLGRAATKTAMEAAAKRASLENMVKWVGGWFVSSGISNKKEVGVWEECTSSLYSFVFSSIPDLCRGVGESLDS